MKNYETYKEQILDLSNDNLIFGINEEGEVFECLRQCEFCIFNQPDSRYLCESKKMVWLFEESDEEEIDWSDVEVDTPILVKDDLESEWKVRYFADYIDGNVFAWCDGATSLTHGEKQPALWNYAKLYEK